MRIALAVLLLAACQTAHGRKRTASHADCTLIAQTLTSLELGNYAEPEQRAPREHELAERCLDAALTDDEASCLLSASRETLPYCPRPLAVAHRDMPKLSADAAGLPPSCVRYLAYIEQLASCPQIPIDSRKAIRDAADQAATAWRQMNQQGAPYLEDACASGARALAQSVQSNGC